MFNAKLSLRFPRGPCTKGLSTDRSQQCLPPIAMPRPMTSEDEPSRIDSQRTSSDILTADPRWALSRRDGLSFPPCIFGRNNGTLEDPALVPRSVVLLAQAGTAGCPGSCHEGRDPKRERVCGRWNDRKIELPPTGGTRGCSYGSLSRNGLSSLGFGFFALFRCPRLTTCVLPIIGRPQEGELGC